MNIDVNSLEFEMILSALEFRITDLYLRSTESASELARKYERIRIKINEQREY